MYQHGTDVLHMVAQSVQCLYTGWGPDISLYHRVQISFGTHPMGTGDSFLRGNAVGARSEPFISVWFRVHSE